MGFDVGRIQGRTATCEMPCEGDSITLTYYVVKAGEISQADMNDLAARCKEHAGDPRMQKRLQAELAAPLLADWTVTNGADPYPHTVEALAALDVAFVSTVIAAIIEHVNTGKVTGELLSTHGTVTTSQTVDAESSPATQTNRASHRAVKSRKSRSNAA